jgi:hypothetical protein
VVFHRLDAKPTPTASATAAASSAPGQRARVTVSSDSKRPPAPWGRASTAGVSSAGTYVWRSRRDWCEDANHSLTVAFLTSSSMPTSTSASVARVRRRYFDRKLNSGRRLSLDFQEYRAGVYRAGVSSFFQGKNELTPILLPGLTRPRLPRPQGSRPCPRTLGTIRFRGGWSVSLGPRGHAAGVMPAVAARATVLMACAASVAPLVLAADRRAAQRQPAYAATPAVVASIEPQPRGR